MSYVCPNCHAVFAKAQTVVSLVCPYCNLVNLIHLDDDIAKPIVSLWKLGIATALSCQGHKKDDKPYILFPFDINLLEFLMRVIFDDV